MSTPAVALANPTASAGFGRALTLLRERVAGTLRRHAERGRMRRELSGYTDHELADIGIVRANIPDVVKGRFRRRD